jgi:tetratricopeptide (TPR) repeat protein
MNSPSSPDQEIRNGSGQGEEPARRFWRLWRQGGRPEVLQFLAGAGGLSAAEVVAVLRVDQQERWRLGDRVAAETYLQQLPCLQADYEHALDLVYGEYLLREALGHSPTLDEYLTRFPQFADDFPLQIEVHLAVKARGPFVPGSAGSLAFPQKSGEGDLGPAPAAPPNAGAGAGEESGPPGLQSPVRPLFAVTVTILLALLGLGAWSYTDLQREFEENHARLSAADRAHAEEARRRRESEELLKKARAHQAAARQRITRTEALHQAAVAGQVKAGRQCAALRGRCAEAVRGWHQARQAVDRLTRAIRTDRALRQPELHASRRQWLQKAVRYYAAAVGRRSDDPAREADRARAFLRYGQLTAELGSGDQGLQLCRKGVDILEQLSQEAPGEAAPRDALARGQARLGDVARRLRRTDQAEAAYARAVALQEELVRKSSPGRLQTAYRHRLALGYHRLGVLYADTRRFGKATRAFRQALSVRDQVPTPQRDASFQESHAWTLIELARLYPPPRRYREGEILYRRAIALFRALVRAHPDQPDYQLGLARGQADLGYWYFRARRFPDAEAACGQAVEAYGMLVRAHPSVTAYESRLAVVHTTLGDVYSCQGKKGLALRSLGQAHRLFARLAGAYPGVSRYALDLGASHGLLALARRRHGDSQSAVKGYDQAVKQFQGVLTAEPANLQARSLLRSALSERGETLSTLGRHVEALRDIDLALALAGGDFKNVLRLQRARTLALKGDHRGGAAEARALAGLPRVPALARYNLACVFALCAAAVRRDTRLAAADRDRQAEHHAGWAVKMLDRARQAGYFKNPSNHRLFHRDADLKPLRARPDFKILLRRLEKVSGRQSCCP